MIFCISGFLGLKEDWDFLKKSDRTFTAHCAEEFLSEDFEIAAQKINEMAAKEKCNVIMGYSLGGRLALHALLANPDQWKAGLILSSHPGLEEEKEISERGENDLKWARRFLDLPWSEVMAQWNAQPVFQGSSPLQRDESQFKREELADLLTYFSLARQDDLRARLKNLGKPLLFIAGEKDKKFSKLAKEMTYLDMDNFEMFLLPQAGHRVLEYSTQVVEQMNQFLEK